MTERSSLTKLLAEDGKVRLHSDPQCLDLMLTVEVPNEKVDGATLVAQIRKLLPKAKIDLEPEYMEILEKSLGDFERSPRSVELLSLVTLPGPVHGQDAPIYWEIPAPADDCPEATMEDETLVVDTYAVQEWVSVRKGDVLFRLGEETEGHDDVNLRGEVAPAKPGAKISIQTKRGCRYEDRACVATCDGTVIRSSKQISVEPALNIQGDLSFDVGNIDFHGTVRISGSVPPGFCVRTSGDLSVGGVIKGAEIEVQGNLEVRGGITDEATVTVDGDVKSTYIHHCTVRCGGDVTVRKEIIHSVVRANGDVLCPRGSIIGKNVSAGGNIEVGSAGSKEDVPTLLMAGASPAVADCILETIAEQEIIDLEIKDIDSRSEGKLDPTYLATLKGPVRQHYRSIAKKREKLVQKKQDLETSYHALIAEDKRTRLCEKDPVIAISRERHPNLSVQIGASVRRRFDEYAPGKHDLVLTADGARILHRDPSTAKGKRRNKTNKAPEADSKRPRPVAADELDAATSGAHAASATDPKLAAVPT